jgi:ureidoglycolate dehydrogenase (NAD+)
MTRTATPEALAAFSLALLKSAGGDAASAEAATAALMHASLHGIDSHGVRLLPWYANCLRSGLCKGARKIKVSYPRRAAALVDADDGMGHLATYTAMDEACGLARECGIGMAAVINSTHFGAAGTYALAAAEAGFIGFVTAKSGAFVIPHGGSKPVHGTNPIAMAAPNLRGDPFLLDMATSSIPWNKVLRLRTEGLELPKDTAVDSAGGFVIDPNLAVALALVGGADYGYKGAGLAGLAEVLSGVLTGMGLSVERDWQALADTKMGHFVMAIDPTLFMPMEQFAGRLQTYLDVFKSQPGTYAAGGPEWERRRQREADGIPLPEGLHAELKAAADAARVTFPF